MDPARPGNSKKLLTLQQAAQSLAVSIDVLLSWNEHNILKPTITQTGEIGYSQEQINHFLAIRQSLQNSNASHEETESLNNQTNISPTSIGPEVNKTSFYANSNPFSSRIAILLSSITVLILITLFSQQNKLKLLLSDFSLASNKETGVSSVEKVLGSQTSKLPISKSNASASPIRLVSKTDSNKKLSENKTTIENRLATTAAIFGKKVVKSSTANSQADQTPVAIPLFGQNEKTQNVSGKVDIISYSEVSNFASSTSCPSCTTSKNTENDLVFDNTGNIKDNKGENANANLLATTFGTTGMVQGSTSFKQPAGLNALLGFFTLSLLSFFFVYKKQFAYFMKKPGATEEKIPNLINNSENQKILEVDQKTDGMVVLYFKGKEFKISKPELDSESDQFINRLMELTQLNAKEIDYDTLKDEKVRFNTPLSRLVTRLGFVGIKRDLFFPRTSKNKVLFRKYITEQDLISMNLTTDQISSGFANFS
jgi:hypothetical protein